MNIRVRRGFIFIISFVFILVIALTYRQAFSDEIASHPGNHRALIEEFSIERGKLLAADGTILARSEERNKIYHRVYPEGKVFASVTGYYSPTRGRFGLEASLSRWLAAKDHFRSFDDWRDSLMKRKRRGLDVKLTIRPDLQMKSWELLEGHRGSIVALDPRTGAVLALASRPSYDPNMIDEKWREIVSSDGLLLNRATQGLYPPGSTFKIVTTAGALDSGIATPDKMYDGPASLKVYGGQVTNFANKDVGKLSLAKAFAKSTNTIFAQVGLELGAPRLVNAAKKFGLDKSPPFELPVAKSSIPSPGSMDKVMLAWTAVGQGKTLVTPLQMALISAAVANEGKIYRPFIVDTVGEENDLVYRSQRPRLWSDATTKETSKQITQMMEDVVLSGTGRAAALTGIMVAGKTGTAEFGKESAPHAWFIGFAPADDPKIAIAVFLEQGGLGGQAAAPIARQVFEKAIGSGIQ